MPIVHNRTKAYCASSEGPTELAVGTGGDCLDISFPLFISFSLKDRSTYTDIWSQRALKSKTTNQTTHLLQFFSYPLYVPDFAFFNLSEF